jgi:ArsR family transcriptional regulator
MATGKEIGIRRVMRSRQSDPCCSCEPLTISTAEVAGQVKLLSALADPTRLQIVEMLAGLDEPLCVCDITSQFDLGQPTISHHLRVLREAGLVNWEKRGLWVYYTLNHAAMRQVSDYLGRLLPVQDLAGLGST